MFKFSFCNVTVFANLGKILNLLKPPLPWLYKEDSDRVPVISCNDSRKPLHSVNGSEKCLGIFPSYS